MSLVQSNRLCLHSEKGSIQKPIYCRLHVSSERAGAHSQRPVHLTHQGWQNASDSTCVQPEQGMQISSSEGNCFFQSHPLCIERPLFVQLRKAGFSPESSTVLSKRHRTAKSDGLGKQTKTPSSIKEKPQLDGVTDQK